MPSTHESHRQASDRAVTIASDSNGESHENLTDRELRVLGEAVAGCSGKQFVAREGNTFHIRASEHGPGRVIFSVDPEQQAGMANPPDGVVVRKGSRELDIRGKYDALFWSKAACEKFVLSYYNALRLLSAQSMKDLIDGINHADTIAIAHEFKSPTSRINARNLVGSMRFLDRRLVDERDNDPWVSLEEILSKD